MVSEQKLEYSLVQFVGDPVRREAVNVGVAVTGPAGVVVMMDRAAHVRLATAWPSFDRRLYFAAMRDLRHLLADTHQLFLLERAVQFTGHEGRSLTELSSAMANQFGLTAPRPYEAASAMDAAHRLFDRLVRIQPRPAGRRERHMTRGTLRVMITEILSLWASARAPGLVLEAAAEIQGRIAPHTVDLVAFEGQTPHMLFFATPVEGDQAALIRDALPTVVEDLQREHPDATFYAVLGERRSSRPQDRSDAERLARAVLSRVEGLEILGLGELREEFGSQAAVAL